MRSHGSWYARLLRGSFAVGALVWIACAGPAGDGTSTSFPETCEEAQEIAVDATGDRPDNGTYTLYVDGDEAQPWDAYCHNMKRAEPLEYLRVDEDSNYSQKSDGTNLVVKTSYRRLRIDPRRLEIDPNDTQFASSEPDSADDLPAGLALFDATALGGTLAAEARIDLRDTGFSLDENVDDGAFFCITTANDRSADQSEIQIADDLQSVTLHARNTGLEASTVAGGCASLQLAPVPLAYGDAHRRRKDAGVDSGTDAGVDAAIDSGSDAGVDAAIDSGSDAGVDAAIDSGLLGAKRIFTTAAVYDGNLGGVAGADAKCQSDANRPNSSMYKALIADGFYRLACTQGNGSCAANQHIDWVMAPNTAYVRPDGTTLIGMTNSAGIISLNGATLAAPFGSYGVTAYTGLNSDWTYAGSGCAGACDCMWFTANSISYSAPIGDAWSITGNSISMSTAKCTTSHAVYCVEQ